MLNLRGGRYFPKCALRCSYVATTSQKNPLQLHKPAFKFNMSHRLYTGLTGRESGSAGLVDYGYLHGTKIRYNSNNNVHVPRFYTIAPTFLGVFLM